ncbi:MAG: hypothetical protein HY911_04565 [Desulfobacterales bacterium]|nr:hypothetical protein [Desulfobacterales bacterium]
MKKTRIFFATGILLLIAAGVFAAKITDYLTADAPVVADYAVIVDVSDTSQAATGTTKKAPLSALPVSDAVAEALALKENKAPSCLTAAPASPANGQMECADGDTWQIDVSQGSDDWLVRYRASDTTWVGVYNLTDGIQIVESIDETVYLNDDDGAGSLLWEFNFSAPRTIGIIGDLDFSIPAVQTRCQTWAGIAAASDHMVTSFPHAITIRAVRVVQRGATNVIGHLDECDSAGAACAGVDGATDITATSTQSADDGTLSNPSIDANDVIQWHTTSVSGTNTDCMVCMDYTFD